jgi:hypothetical protein
MCPVCVANSVVIVAGSAGGILAVCIGKLRKFFTANRPGKFLENKGEMRWR